MIGEDLFKSKTMDNMYRINILVPHLVILIRDYDTLYNLSVKKYGKIINNLLEIKVNINFVSIENNEFYIRTFERGVNSETLACGTGCCAFGFVVKNFLNREIVSIRVKSGNLVMVEFKNDTVYLEGEANNIYKGVFSF